MRGTHRGTASVRTHTGIIPACAGNTTYPKSGTPRLRDHPRVCGEHQLKTDKTATIEGSSPRVRGTRIGRRTRTRREGIIPACAGNTAASWFAHDLLGDHPRVCGEHVPGTTGKVMMWGSSPRVRGTLIEPEYLASLDVDHPRVCGEHAPGLELHVPTLGSSPRVRGTLCAGHCGL